VLEAKKAKAMAQALGLEAWVPRPRTRSSKLASACP
jgi:hypothetical protein